MDSFTALLYVNIAIWCGIAAYLAFLAYTQAQVQKKINLLNDLNTDNNTHKEDE